MNGFPVFTYRPAGGKKMHAVGQAEGVVFPNAGGMAMKVADYDFNHVGDIEPVRNRMVPSSYGCPRRGIKTSAIYP